VREGLKTPVVVARAALYQISRILCPPLRLISVLGRVGQSEQVVEHEQVEMVGILFLEV
jgi:hypothetical protein